ncbi:DUF4115 domain-containing protein [candidate division KSB1 bacterium]|nr:DUF4115 domain-containing protein [candidate division KSB1 bacterium]
MNNELKLLGGELRKEREARGVSLKYIADQTKISITFLEAMEAGDFSFLPKPYPRNFLKTYLEHLGGRQERLMNRFDACMQPKIVKEDVRQEKAPAARQETESDLTGSLKESIQALRANRWSMLVVGAAIIAVMLTVLSISRNDDRMPAHNLVNGQTVVPQDSQLATISPFSFRKKNMHLNLVASQKTWMQIAIDDSAAIEYIFQMGDSSEWLAKERFLVRIGNGAGIRLYLNGNDLGPLGRDREVVNLVVTKDGIERNQF